MDLEERRALLRSSPYFTHMAPDIIERVCRECVVRDYRTGQRIFTEGDEAGEATLHLVSRGVVRIFKASLEGREQVLRLMRAGDSFADVAAFDGGPYPANADALEPSTVLVIPRKILWAVLAEHPDIALVALQIMASRLRHMTSLVEDLSLRRVTSRVAKLLLESDSEIRLNQTQMAAMVGTAREMVNRSLHTLEDIGAIELLGSSIIVLDRRLLVGIVSAG